MSTPTLELPTQNHWLADGTQTVWDFSFANGYISRDFVKASSNTPLGVTTEIVVTPEMFFGDFQLHINPPVAAGDTLIIYRATQRGFPLVDWSLGARINEENLDTMARQSVHIAAEMADYFGVTTTEDLLSLAQQAATAASTATTQAGVATTQAGAASSSAAAAAASAASLANPLLPLTGAVARPLLSRLSDTVHIKDFGAVGDGVADDTTKVQAAVNCCITGGLTLEWSAGIYKTTASITGFHSVRHRGVGRITRGASTFYIQPTTQTNVIYASTTGLDANDGLSVSQPKRTLQSTIDTLIPWREAIAVGGIWRVQLTAGTFARGSFPIEGLRSRYPIEVLGAAVGGHPNVPTTLVKEGATQAAVGLRAENNTNLIVQDIKFEDFNGSTASSGILVNNGCDLRSINCHYEDCYIGINGSEWSEIDVKGGVFNDCGFLNSVTGGGYAIKGLFHCKYSIGLQNAAALTQGPFFTNNHFGVFSQELVTGHVDWCTFTNNVSGIRVSINSRVNCDGSSFTGNGVACWATDNSVISAFATTTFSSNTQNIIVSGGSSSSGSPVFVGWEASYGRNEYIVWGSKAQQIVNSLGATVVQTGTVKGGLLRETLGSANPPKKIGFRLFGTLAGTADIKRIQLRLGASLTNITFTSTETGAFEADGVVVFQAPDVQIARITASRHLSTGSRVAVTPMTETMVSDTVFNIEALVGNVADSITLDYVELYVAGI